MKLRSFAYHVVKFLPASVTAFLRKHKRKRAAQRRRQTRDAAIAEHGQVSVAELLVVLRELGINAGCTLFVQSSFNDLHTFSGRPVELLDALRALVGDTGTLLMPAYTVDSPLAADAVLDAVVDVANLPTYTGILSELFRRTPGVLRSVHPRHSICALGPLAPALLAGHENCVYADGPDSPMDRLRQRDDALILTIGLEPGFTSFLHWIEDHEPDRFPLRVHEPAPKRYRVRHPDGRTIHVDDMQVRPEVAARINLPRIAGELGPEVLRWRRHRGIELGLYFVKPLSARLVALRDSGITHFH